MTTSSVQVIEVGPVIGLAVRPGKNEPMQVVEQITVTVESGVVEDFGKSLRRGITLISALQWQQACDELCTELPWHLRRANVLIEAASLEHLIDQTIRIGEVEVNITSETEPCALMDELHPGLKDVLEPDCRGGVLGWIVVGGMIGIGDVVRVVGGP